MIKGRPIHEIDLHTRQNLFWRKVSFLNHFSFFIYFSDGQIFRFVLLQKENWGKINDLFF